MKIYSVDSTESREKQKNPVVKYFHQAGLDLRTSDFQVLLSTTELQQHVLSATEN